MIQANINIYNKHNNHPNISQKQIIGTTLTAVLITRVFTKGRKALYRAYVVAVGDSPAFIKSDRRLKQVTTNESNSKGQLTNSVGTYPDLEINDSENYFYEEIKPRDAMLICTDGVANQLAPKDIFRILRGDNAQFMADNITGRAVSTQNRTHDNASAVAVKVIR